MPQEDQQRRTSLVVPVLLISLGALFLVRNWYPGASLYQIFRTYWPLLLVLVGIGKIWDYSRSRALGQGASGQTSSGVALGSTLGVVAFVLVIVVLLGHYGRHHSFRRGANADWGSDSGDDSSWNNDESANHTEEVIDLQGAKSVHAELKMGAGEMNVTGGSAHLLNSRFRFSRKWDSPKVDYQVTEGKGELEISQDQGSGLPFGHNDNTWDLTFSNDVPINMVIQMGAGQGNLRMRDMNLTDLELQMGAGQVELDLTGPHKSDLRVDIKGGVGQATIRLPRDVGVSAHAAGGLGSISASGFQRDGNEYHNEMYGKTAHTIRLDVEGGIGKIDLIQQ